MDTPDTSAPVRFGPKDHQQITADVASMVLTRWCEQHPAQFGAYLAEAMTGQPPRTGRRARP